MTTTTTAPAPAWATGPRVAIADGVRTHRLGDGGLLVENGPVAHHVHDPAAALVLETLAVAGGSGDARVLEDLAVEVGRRGAGDGTDPAARAAADEVGALADLAAGTARVARSVAGLVVDGVLEVTTRDTVEVTVVDLARACGTARDVAALLRGAGALVGGPGPHAPAAGSGFVVLVCDDVLRADVARRLDALLAAGAVVLPVTAGAGEVGVGPLLAPGRCTTTSRCASCLRTALVRNLPEVLVRARTDPRGAAHPAAPGPLLAALGAAVAATAALDTARALHAGGPPGEGGGPLRAGSLVDADGPVVLRAWRTGALAPVAHAVPSSCPRTGPRPDGRAARERRPGSLRALSAQEVLESTAHLVSDRTGLLTPPRVVAEGPAGVVVSTTCAVPAAAGAAARGTRWQRVVAHGSGSTRAQATAAAVGEALERCSAGWPEDHDARGQVRAGAGPTVLRACADDLGASALMPQDLLAFSDEQRAAALPGVPAAMPRDVVTDWCRLQEWGGGAERWVPAAAVHFGHPDVQAARWCLPDSNGCAVGADLPEAVLAGLLELVERDAVARWWYPAARVPGVALDVLDHLDPAAAAQAAAVRADLRGRGGDLHLLDVTSDLGVPVVVAVGRGAAHAPVDVRGPAQDDGGDGLLLGFGAHPDLRTAAARAVGELVLVTALVRAGSAAAPAGWDRARLEDLPFLRPARPTTTTTSPSRPPVGRGLPDLLDEVVARVRAAGTTVLVQDLTRPWSGLAAARVVAPALRPWYRRLGPGRLTPGADGWNPWPLPV